MKTKPFLKAATGIVAITAILLMVKCKTTEKVQKIEVYEFLKAFNKHIVAGNTDSALACFDASKRHKVFARLTNLIEGKKDLNSNSKPLAGISLDVDGATIKVINGGLVVASVPVKLSHEALTGKQSLLKFTIHKTKGHHYKIMTVDAKGFIADYIAYESFIKSKTLTDKDIYSPATLAAFKTAESLKAAYDSVIWFAHIDKQTFFYVVKGTWDMYKDLNREKDSVIQPYKMGLVNADLKEVISPGYDLIYNISGTFPGLVEVEKDGKRGFYNLDGKIIIPVEYDQILPLTNDANLAVLRKGKDYFYLKPDMAISEKVDLKIADFISRVKSLASSSDLVKNTTGVVTEYNSREENGGLYIAPSYLVDLNLTPRWVDFKNPLRNVADDNIHTNYEVKHRGTDKQPENWLVASFYSIRDYFLGGRSEFYDKKNILIVDNKNNRILTQDLETDFSPMGGNSLEGLCDVNSIKVINDSLYEVKAGAVLWFELYDSTKTVEGGPYYHYLAVKNNKLVELPNGRNFGFTKYVKMDDSYLNACYNVDVSGPNDKKARKTIINRVTPEMLRYMKNEIFADYGYQFKDKRWDFLFSDNGAYQQTADGKKPGLANVDDSLTVVDKYNINWINERLKGTAKPPQNTIAAK
ncbi:WG repeat-containing protein [Mucilaginibacter sp.]|uniref:WG repeat-containing protein n=1 Tax=Mucilaginibacter sp. TaxID=1882438 RepID=UPI002639381E|nr:WG repeat-containing protein [Mucilaginibacter sp.]MDB4918706.1 hypothetical protein [Mucilaginibacter sp.]